MHYVKVDENNGGDAGYDWARAREADQLMRDFLAEPNRAHFNEGFTVSAVGHALDRMHQGAAGIDGTSKKWIDPLRETKFRTIRRLQRRYAAPAFPPSTLACEYGVSK